MWIVKNKKIFFIFSGVLILATIFSIVKFGLNFGIDFTGGTLLEVKYETRPDLAVIDTDINGLNLGEFSLQPVDDSGLIVRTKSVTEVERVALSQALSKQSLAEEVRLSNIGPTIGNELKNKAYVAIIIVIVLIIIFIAWAFRKTSGQVSAWTYGFIAVVAMIHDVLIPVGIFTWLAHFVGGFEINALFITAILATLGYSVHDTIVVFDRVRENLSIKQKGDFDELVGESLMQTMARSINTSLTTLLVLVAVYFFGGEATKEFSLVFIIGIIAGTYSSIFVAAPLLTLFRRKKNK